jgi:hypothetical protein
MLVIYGKKSKNNEISFLGNNYNTAMYNVSAIKAEMDIN